MFEIELDTCFSASHAIWLPDGTLEPVHGHNWHVTACVGRDTLDTIETVMDFHDLEAMLKAITAPLHNRHLNELAPFQRTQQDRGISPTAEQVAHWIGQQLITRLPDTVKLHWVQISEAVGCRAVWRP